MLTCVSDNMDLTENDNVLLNVVKTDPELVLTLSIRELAKLSFVSPSAVVRFYKKMGFKTYQGFLIELAKETEQHVVTAQSTQTNLTFNYQELDANISKKIAEISCEMIKKTSELLKEKDLVRAATLLVEANSIYGFGTAQSFNQLSDFQNKMLRIHKFIKLIPLQVDQSFLVGEAREGDVVIVSLNGEQYHELSDLLKAFKKKGVHIICLTSSQDDEVLDLATTVFNIPLTGHDKSELVVYASQIAIEYLLNTLYAYTYKQNYENNNIPSSIKSMSFFR